MLYEVFFSVVVYALLGILGFIAFRNELIIQRRIPIFVCLAMLVTMMTALLKVVDVMQFYYPQEINGIPCNVEVWVLFLFIPEWFISIYLRCAHFAQTFILQQRQLYISYGGTSLERLSNPKIAVVPGSPTPDGNSTTTIKRKGYFHSISEWVVMKLIHTLIRLEWVGCKLLVKYHIGNPAQYQTSENVKKFGWVAMVIFMLLTLLIEFIAIAIQYLFALYGDHRTAATVGCGGVLFSDYELIYVFVCLFCLVTPFVIRGILSFRDDIGLRLELTLTLIVFYPLYIMFMVSFFLYSPQSLLASISPDIWLLLLALACFTFAVYLPIGLHLYHRFLPSTIQIDYTLEHFDCVMNNKLLQRKLKQLAANQLCLENILFIEEIRDLRKKNAQGVVLVQLYDKYIAPGSPNEVNLPYHVTLALTKQVQADILVLNDLEAAYTHILDLVLINTFFHFVRIYREIPIPKP